MVPKKAAGGIRRKVQLFSRLCFPVSATFYSKRERAGKSKRRRAFAIKGATLHPAGRILSLREWRRRRRRRVTQKALQVESLHPEQRLSQTQKKKPAGATEEQRRLRLVSEDLLFPMEGRRGEGREGKVCVCVCVCASQRKRHNSGRRLL